MHKDHSMKKALDALKRQSGCLKKEDPGSAQSLREASRIREMATLCSQVSSVNRLLLTSRHASESILIGNKILPEILEE